MGKRRVQHCPSRLIFVFLFAAFLVGSGCARTRMDPSRSFLFARDTPAFPNQTVWLYDVDSDTGRMTHRRREPRPEYAQRCFVLVRVVKEFHQHAHFDPQAPRISPKDYRRAVRQVVGRSPRRESTDARRVVIPGFSGLKEFSEVYGDMLRQEAGGRWQSYVQRGHWRMVLPFSGPQRKRLADRLATRLVEGGDGSPAILHVIRFPDLTINHALLAFAMEPTASGYRFLTYDPNDAERPVELVFHRETRRWELPALPYFLGGPVDVYEIYHSLMY